MRRSLPRLGLAALLAFAFAGLAVSQPGPVPLPAKATGGKEDNGPKPEGYQSFVFPSDRDQTGKLDALIGPDNYLQKKSIPWDIVTGIAQQLLDAKSDSFYALKDPKTKNETGARVSVKVKVGEVIGEFPKEGRQFYELTYGPAAEAALKDAVKNGYDRLALAEISQRYFHTKPGAQATLLLAALDLESGNYAEAAYEFQRLLARPDSDDVLTPRVLFKAAVALKRSGDLRQAESASKLIDRLEKRFPRDGLAIGGKTYSLDELKKELDRPVEVGNRLGDGQVTTRYGDASHTARGQGGTPFLDPAFTVPMVYRTDEDNRDGADWVRQNLESVVKHLDRSKGQVAVPGFFPVTAPNLLLYRGYDGVYAVVTRDGYVAYKGTPNERTFRAGEVLWFSPAKGGLQTLMSEDKTSTKQTVQQWWTNFWASRVPSLLFENAQVGSLSHDGKYVYFVDDLAIPPQPQVFNPNMGFPNPPGVGGVGGAVDGMTDYSRLVAVDINTGKLEWALGGRSGAAPSDEEEHKAANAKLLTDGALFLGPPLPVNGKLFALYERNNQVVLACLDPSRLVTVPLTGSENKPRTEKVPELVWAQNLGAPNTRLNQDSLRRVQPAYLAYADGVLVCPTNCGAVVAVDVNARSLLWARYYGSTQDPGPMLGEGQGPGGGFRRRPPGMVVGPQNQTLPTERWRAAAPIVAGGKVVLTAHDADHIQCLDLRSGELLWSDPRHKDDLYVGGVLDGKVLVVGKESVRAYNLAGDGKGHPELAWRNLQIGTPCGQGVASREGLYYVPMVGSPDKKDSNEPQVWAIDVATGQARSKTQFRRKDAGNVDSRLVLGNLVFHEGQLFAQSAEQISAFPLIDLKLREMTRLLKDNPKDPVGLAARGELALDSGKVRDAIADFKEAEKNNPPDAVRRKLRDKLYLAYTELLRNKFEDGEPFLKEYEALCEVPIDTEDADRKRQLLDEQVRRKGLYLALVAKGREKQGRLADAFDAYRAFAALGDNKQLVDIYDEPNGKTRPDVWARGRIDAMIRAAKDPAARKPLEDRVRADWDSVRGANDLGRLREFVSVFGPYFPEGRDAQLLLADKLLQTNNDEDGREAQTLLMRLWATSEDPAYAARAVEALARLMTRRAMLEDAVGLYHQLGTRYADVPVRDGKTGAEIYGELVTDKRLWPCLELGGGPRTSKYKVDPQSGQQMRPNFVQAFAVQPEGDLLPFFRRLQLTMQLNPSDNTWSLIVADRMTGEERCRFNGLSPIQTQMGLNQGAPTWRIAQASGHLLLVTVGQWAYCFDLAEKQKLWDYNLLGTAAHTPGSQPRIETDKDGDLQFHYEDGWTLRLGRSSILQPTYACLVTREGLVAMDPATKAKLWVRTLDSGKVQVFGDAKHIFVVDGAKSKVLRAVDGTEVPGAKNFAPVFTSPDRVAVLGRHILLNAGGGHQVRALQLYDPLTGEDVWRREFPPKSLALKTLDHELTGVLLPDGKFEVLDAHTGKTLFAGALDADRVDAHMRDASGNVNVTNPILLADADRYFLFLSRTQDASRGPIVYGVTMIRTQPVNGVAYAFDKATGKRLWFTERLFEHQMILLERFEDLPCIVAAAQVMDDQTHSYVYQVVVLDKQLGKVRYLKGHPQNGLFTSAFADPKTHAVEFWRFDLRLRIVPDDDGKAEK